MITDMTELRQEKYPESHFVIRFQDCDAFGHLNNAAFIRYFINAREDHLRTFYGFNLYEHARNTQENWFVTRHEISYIRPAALGENVLIRTALIRVSDRDLTVEGAMYDAAGRKLKAVQWTTFRYVDLGRGRSIPHPSDVAALLDDILIDEGETQNLDARVQELKSVIKLK